MNPAPLQNRMGLALWVGLLLALGLAFGLRLFHLSTNSLWGDEANSASLAAQPLEEILRRTQGGVHPPFYFAILHWWALLAGTSEFSLRFVSLFFGVVAVAGTFTLGRWLLGPGVGLGAALLLTINPFQVWYSQEARMYTMLTALGLLASLLLVRLMGQWSRRIFWGYVLAASLTLFTHYYGAFLLAFHNLYGIVGLGQGRRHHLRRWLGSQALVFLFFAPWLMLSFAALPTAQQSLPSNGNSPWVEFWENSLVGLTLEAPLAEVAALATAPVLLWGIWILYRRSALSIGGLYFATLVVLPFLVSPFRIVEPRYLATTSPGYVLILAAALFGSRRLIPFGLLLSLALAGASALSLDNLYFNPAYGKGGYRELTQEIAALAQPGDAVVVNGASQSFQYEYYGPPEPAVFYIPSRKPLDKGAALAQLEELTQRYSGLWFLKSAWVDYDPEMVVAGWLDENTHPVSFHPVFGHQGSDEWLAYYRSPRWPAPTWQERQVTFGDQLTLLGYSTEDAAPSGGSLALTLRWRGEPALRGDYKIFLHLRDNQGNLWAQRDAPPGNGAKSTSHWPPGESVTDRHGLRIPPGTPPGQYTLYLGVYPAAGGPPLPPIGVADASEIKLALVTVDPTAAPAPSQALRPSHPADLALGPDLKLLGYDLPQPVSPGQVAVVKLHWKAETTPAQDYRLTLKLQDVRGNVSFQSFPLSSYPPTQWRPGEVITGIYPLLAGPHLEPGEGILFVQLEETEASLALPTRPLIQARPRSFALPQPQHRVDAELGGLVRLLGYDLEQSQGRLRLTLYWQALTETTTNYQVFTHLVSASGHPVAQHDDPPDGGQAPTASWLPGEVIADGHDIVLPPSLAPGDYRLAVGLYEPISGNRLQTPDGQDAIWLSEVVEIP